MQIVYGTAGLTLAVLLYAVVLIGCRNPRQPGWASDFLVGSIYVPVIGGLFVLGLGCFLNYVLSSGRPPVGALEGGLAVGIAAVGLVVLKALRIRKHLADYASTNRSAEAKPLRVLPGGQPSDHPPSVPTPQSSSGKHAA